MRLACKVSASSLGTCPLSLSLIHSSVYRHFFGVNTQVQDALFLVEEDSILIYVAGHNIVLYKIDEKEQVFLQGLEGSEAITHVSLSKSGKFLCVCERGQEG